jgi:hypothetical protein
MAGLRVVGPDETAPPLGDEESWRAWVPRNRQEMAVIAHMRGWPHHGPACPVCMKRL